MGMHTSCHTHTAPTFFPPTQRVSLLFSFLKKYKTTHSLPNRHTLIALNHFHKHTLYLIGALHSRLNNFTVYLYTQACISHDKHKTPDARTSYLTVP